VDADDLRVGDLTEYLPDRSDIVLFREPTGVIGNNFIAAAPRHRLIGIALERAQSSILSGDVDTTWLSLGPGLLTRATAAYLSDPDCAPMLLERFALYSEHELRRAVAMHRPTPHKRTVKYWNRAESVGKRLDLNWLRDSEPHLACGSARSNT
jgi:hypothetical protein